MLLLTTRPGSEAPNLEKMARRLLASRAVAVDASGGVGGGVVRARNTWRSARDGLLTSQSPCRERQRFRSGIRMERARPWPSWACFTKKSSLL
jgi:hypothetical protein